MAKATYSSLVFPDRHAATDAVEIGAPPPPGVAQLGAVNVIVVTNYATMRISTHDSHLPATVLEAICAPRITTENHIVELAFIAFVGTSVLMGLELRDFLRRGRAVAVRSESLRTERSTIVEEKLYKEAA